MRAKSLGNNTTYKKPAVDYSSMLFAQGPDANDFSFANKMRELLITIVNELLPKKSEATRVFNGEGFTVILMGLLSGNYQNYKVMHDYIEGLPLNELCFRPEDKPVKASSFTKYLFTSILENLHDYGTRKFLSQVLEIISREINLDDIHYEELAVHQYKYDLSYLDDGLQLEDFLLDSELMLSLEADYLSAHTIQVLKKLKVDFIANIPDASLVIPTIYEDVKSDNFRWGKMSVKMEDGAFKTIPFREIPNFPICGAQFPDIKGKAILVSSRLSKEQRTEQVENEVTVQLQQLNNLRTQMMPVGWAAFATIEDAQKELARIAERYPLCKLEQVDFVKRYRNSDPNEKGQDPVVVQHKPKRELIGYNLYIRPVPDDAAIAHEIKMRELRILETSNVNLTPKQIYVLSRVEPEVMWAKSTPKTDADGYFLMVNNVCRESFSVLVQLAIVLKRLCFSLRPELAEKYMLKRLYIW